MGTREILGRSEWRLISEDHDVSDTSSVTVYREANKCWIELKCNDETRRLQIRTPEPGTLVVDESRLDHEYPICVDTDREVASVAERLGLRLA